MDLMVTPRGKAADAPGSFLDLKDLLRVVYRQRFVIGATVFVIVAIGAAFLLTTPKRFTATTELVFETQSQKVSPIEDVLPGLSADRSVIESQIETLSSRQLFERAVAKVAARLRSGGEEPVASATEGGGLDPLALAQADPSVETFIADFTGSTASVRSHMGGLKIERRGLSYIVGIAYTSESPQVAALVSTAVADSYIALKREEKLKATEWASERLEDRVQTVGLELREELEYLEKFKTDNNLFTVGDLELGEQLLADYIDRLVSAQFKATNAAATATQLKEAATDPEQLASIANVFQSEPIIELRRQLVEAQARLSEARRLYSANHFAITNARIELDRINEEIISELDRLVKSSLLEMEMASSQVQLFTERMDQLKEEYVRRNEARIELYELESRVEARRQLYTSLLGRLKETEIQTGLQADDARILSYARVPEQHSWPKVKLSIAVLGVGGLVLGLGLALLREILNRTMRNLRDVEVFTGQRPVVAFPRVVQRRRAAGRRRREITAPEHVKLYHGSAYGRAVYRLSLWLDDALAPAKRSTVLVASARETEGRSALALNLAQFERQRGKRVLFVDFTHANALSGPPEPGGRSYQWVVEDGKVVAERRKAPGEQVAERIDEDGALAAEGVMLAELAAGSAGSGGGGGGGGGAGAVAASAELTAGVALLEPTSDRAGAMAVTAWEHPDRDFVTVFCSPNDVLSRRFARFVEIVSPQYDLVIMDWPAMLDPTNTPVVLEHADCVVFVVRAGQTQRDDYRTTLGQFVAELASPVGIVVNMLGREVFPEPAAPRR